MPRIIFTSRYLNPSKSKKQMKNYVNYIATRSGVEKISFPKTQQSPTLKQKDWIKEQISLSPQYKESLAYEDYKQNPTRENASELISYIAENQYEQGADIENYVDYIAYRPRAERGKGGHGLWGCEKNISLSQVAKEAANHKGTIWTHVISLCREDAKRLGYDNAKAWEDLVKSKLPVIAKSMHIPLDKLKWYGAFHDESYHPHIHLMVYSENPNQGYLKKQGIEAMRSAFATSIFQEELYQVYVQKDEARKNLHTAAEKEIKGLVEKLDKKEPPVELVILLEQLSTELKKVKGKTDYGWLKGEPKRLTDRIVSELAKEPDIDRLYQLWRKLKEETVKTYQEKPGNTTKLEEETEFLKIKNMVIRYAKAIQKENIITQSVQKGTVASEETKPVFLSAGKASAELLRSFSRLIEQDCQNRYQQEQERTESKLYQKIKEQKEALGLK